MEMLLFFWWQKNLYEIYNMDNMDFCANGLFIIASI